MSGDEDSRPSDAYARLDGKVASLSAALLARKGAASPSLKRFLNQRSNNPFARCEDARVCQNAATSLGVKRASVSLRLPIPDFLRLKLASAEFERTSQAILLDALRAYLDDKGVEKFGDRPCLKKAAAAADAQNARRR